MDHYVEQRNGEYYVTGTRVPLECVVQEFLTGASPDTIAASYPLLSLEQVYGAVAYYLHNQADLDEHFRKVDEEYERFRAAQGPIDSDLRTRMEIARQQLLGT